MVLKLTLSFRAVLQTQDWELQAGLKACLFPYILPLFVLTCVSYSEFNFLVITRLFTVRFAPLISCTCSIILLIFQS